jgi:ABC-2 type transport system permease protein
MNQRSLRRGCAIVVAVYLLLAVAFYGIGGDQLRFREETTDAINASAPVGELTSDVELRQPFTASADEITGVSMLLSTYDRENSGHLEISIVDESGAVIAQTEVLTAEIEDNAVRTVTFSENVKITSGRQYELVLTSPDSFSGNAITAWYGNTMSATRGEVAVTLSDSEKLTVNGEKIDGVLYYQLSLRSTLWFGDVYWYLAAGVAVLLIAYSIYLVHAAKQNRSTAVLRLLSAFQRYGYLMRQLIARDFKTKYKRSVLGVCWSFLNPLLTMLVQYIVFSTLFKSDIPNFPLYLLTGIVCFNFFNEATNMALQSIVGNASLITKVYVPKYIYPVSRVFSSTINLLLSMIPLFAVMLLTRTPVRPVILFLPFGLICLVALCIGIGLILATAMVFFRDTQFLWGVVIMLWMYATPIFYPESIIPSKFMLIYKCNPLYHIIRVIRTILISGVSPEPKAYALCILASFVPLLLGVVIFKKNQDKFIMNL